MDETCIKAAELIENNFGREAYYENGNYCILGALRAASGFPQYVNDPWSWVAEHQDAYTKIVDACTRVVKILPKEPGCYGCAYDAFDNGSIIHYNDEHCEGGVEAAKLLRTAAEVEL